MAEFAGHKFRKPLAKHQSSFTQGFPASATAKVVKRKGRNHEAWEAAGAIGTAERAHHLYKDILATFEAPPMDVAIKEELADFVARRKAEGGAPTDF